MEVTALCVTLLMSTLMLLHCYCADTAGGVFPRVVPNKLQFFEYDSLSFECEGSENMMEWRVMRRMMGVDTICASEWNQSWGPCYIQHAYKADSGEYWCEAADGERSSSISIIVAAGSVILESPALPVPEGDAVTLSCKNETTSGRIADFYKDGALILTGYAGNVTIRSVSKSDEGLYKCDIIGVGQSAESLLTVTVSPSPDDDTHPGRRASPSVILLWTIVAIFLVTLPLLVVALSLCANCRGLSYASPKTPTPRSRSGETDTVSEVININHLQMTTCSPNTELITFTEEAAASSFTETPDTHPPSADTDQCTTDENSFYYTID
ncbi:low affinity immunoglobulin gamma Fc region receptor III-like [Epinephelus moara]|uniref:low affinity immunoglobulin gamma Fc region receptor III-like n=1 Tax=Epinephelus moara TaxID=300413 RepID=UPI00214EECE3|nr:low affinity immunoglobulin gamma Fc region receptor III-like [Epinephelus moara]XP_049922775.1 low affinity immunoglobulin gamma Fc region receptor III-like [Epinephelus moara]